MSVTDEALKYCMRGIIQYLDGNVDKFRYFVDKAMELYKGTLCTCGAFMIDCKYDKRSARLCTSCGYIWENGKVIRKCIVRRKIA